MASDGRDDDTLTISVPPDVDDWLDEEAIRTGTSRADVCRRLLEAAREIAAEDGARAVADAEELDSLRAQLDAQREEFIDHVEDVRERVIEVKREVDERAPAAHAHDDYAPLERVDALSNEIDSLEANVTALVSAHDDLSDRVDDRYEAHESILADVSGDVDRLSDRSTVLAGAVLELRDDRETLLERERDRAAVDELRATANRLDVRRAACDECGSSVDLALLARPRCPHCGASFADVEGSSSFFGSDTLVTGDPPPLPGRTGTDGPDREQLEAAANDDSAIGGDDR
ncbi:ribbon-helix-helix protein, CopG family [Halovivax cerinus]|uniref:Ribbon-helix-helix protein, CopG family n=1 Tax=Halovivax cerinus TaxID=1487865 RepID=A0ABD5NNI1_9EURY|nr:ribbon-helix-helix protein, CopG family [Halovivax cerinus]